MTDTDEHDPVVWSIEHNDEQLPLCYHPGAMRALRAYGLYMAGHTLNEIAGTIGHHFDGATIPPRPVTRQRAHQLVVFGRRVVQEALPDHCAIRRQLVTGHPR